MSLPGACGIDRCHLPGDRGTGAILVSVSGGSVSKFVRLRRDCPRPGRRQCSGGCRLRCRDQWRGTPWRSPGPPVSRPAPEPRRIGLAWGLSCSWTASPARSPSAKSALRLFLFTQLVPTLGDFAHSLKREMSGPRALWLRAPRDRAGRACDRALVSGRASATASRA